MRWRIILGLVGAVVFLVLVGVYRAHIDRTTFLIAFDRVAVTVVAALWRLLTDRVVLIALAIGIGVWLVRSYLPAIPLIIKQIPTPWGPMGADFYQVLSFLAKSKTGISEPLETEAEPPTSNALTGIVNNLDEGLSWFFLKVANRRVTYKDLAETAFREAKIGKIIRKRDRDLYSSVGKGALAGYLKGIFDCLRNVLFTTEFADDEEESVILRITPEVLNLLEQRVRQSPEHPE